MIEPERGIPLPPVRYGKGGPPYKYNYLDMEIGDSLFLTKHPCTWIWEKRTGYKFSRRAVVEDGVAVWRVWRIEP